MTDQPDDNSSHLLNVESPIKVPLSTPSVTWVKTGFFFALGVCCLAAIVGVGLKVLTSILEIIAPFIAGLAIALLLDPIVDWLEKNRIPRLWSSLIVFGVFLGGAIAVAILTIPALITQASVLATNIPTYISSNSSAVDHFLVLHKKIGPFKMPKNLDVLTSQVTQQAGAFLQKSAGGLAAALLVSISTVFDVIVTLIVGFYLLVDIDRIRARFFYLSPARFRSRISEMGRDIGQVFSDYMRGLLIVCALYGVATTIAIYGLAFVPKYGHESMAQYALLIGFSAGVLYAVPYLGAFTIALVTFLVAVAAGGSGFGLAAVVVTLVVNQTFDNIVTPRVVGGGVGLNPVLAIFSLTLGGALFGFWGLLLSVPIAASIQVVLFRLFPHLTKATPQEFLDDQGVPQGDGGSSEINLNQHEKDVKAANILV